MHISSLVPPNVSRPASHSLTCMSESTLVTHVPLPPRSGRGWWCGILAPDGRIYCAPDGALTLLVLEPSRDPTPVISRLGRPESGLPGRTGIAWSRGVLAPNGKLYCGAFDAASILTVDPDSQSAWAFGNLGFEKAKWSDVVAAGDGKLYAAPFDANVVLVIDPVAETAESIGLSDCGAIGAKWTRGVLGPDGHLYCAPLAASSVLAIEPNNRLLSMLGNFGDAQGKWNEGVLGPDGNIYCSPDSACSVLCIDPIAKAVRTFGDLIEGRRKWTKGVLAPNGKIYCAPLCTNSVLVIDPGSGSVWTLGKLEAYEGDLFLWTQGVVGPDKNVYCAPLCARAVLVIDPVQSALSTIGDYGDEGFKWNQGALGPDGRIYCSPAMNPNVGVLVVEPPDFGWTPERSCYFPRCFVRVLLVLLLIRQRGRTVGFWGALPKDVLIDRIFSCFQRHWFDRE